MTDKGVSPDRVKDRIEKGLRNMWHPVLPSWALHDAPVGINLFPVVCKEIVIKGAFSHIYDVDFCEAVDLLGAGQIKAEPLITSRIGIDDLVEKGFEELLRNKDDHLKILISPQA